LLLRQPRDLPRGPEVDDLVTHVSTHVCTLRH
jgi:hypothetical protein